MRDSDGWGKGGGAEGGLIWGSEFVNQSSEARHAHWLPPSRPRRVYYLFGCLDVFSCLARSAPRSTSFVLCPLPPCSALALEKLHCGREMGLQWRGWDDKDAWHNSDDVDMPSPSMHPSGRCPVYVRFVRFFTPRAGPRPRGRRLLTSVPSRIPRYRESLPTCTAPHRAEFTP